MASPKWTGTRWILQVQKDGIRKNFSSSKPGRAGQNEVRKRYEAWICDEAPSSSKTVERVAKEFLDDVKARRGDDSEAYIQYERYVRLYISPQCGHKKMNKMTLRDWQSVINMADGQKKPLSEKSLKSLRGIIMGIIKFGYQDYQCDLLRGDLYIPKGHPKKEKEILQRDDVRRLLEPSAEWYHPLFCFLLLTGMRPGEALGIQIGDITEDRVFIRRSVNARNKITEGKNENARRMVPIGALASGILRQTIRRNEDCNLHTDWIFCSCDGSQGNQSTMRNNWLKLKKERNLPGTVYSLRHTFVSLMKGVMPEQTIKDIVGHSVSMDTFGTYGHIVEGDDKKAAAVIDLTISGIQNVEEKC